MPLIQKPTGSMGLKTGEAEGYSPKPITSSRAPMIGQRSGSAGRTGNASGGWQASTGPKPMQGSISGSALVENRLNGLLDDKSKYMQSAELAGKQRAHQRGLLNSSIAVGEIEQARIQAALPIAQQDASLYGSRDLADNNFNYSGSLSHQNYGQQSQLSAQNHNQGLLLNQQQYDQQNSQQANNFNQQRITNQEQARAQLQQQQMSAIAQINSNPNLTPENKASQVEALNREYQQRFNEIDHRIGSFGSLPSTPYRQAMSVHTKEITSKWLA